MRVPSSKFRKDVGESLYLFGNFAIPKGEKIPESAKTTEALYCMFTPAEGDSQMTTEAKFIREAISSHAEQMHWARFQDIPVVYHDEAKKVLLLGDAAHSFCPSLGQGATLAIEDACLASHFLLSAIRKGMPLSSALEEISQYQTNRVSTIRDMSNEAAQHISFESDETDGFTALMLDQEAWIEEESSTQWRKKVREMWQAYPRIIDSKRKTWLQSVLEENSTEKYNVEFNQFLSCHLLSAVVALEQLGGNRQRVDRFVNQYTKKLEPSLFATSNALGNNVNEDTHVWDLLGQRKDFYQIKAFYHHQLKAENSNIENLVKVYFPPLLGGIAGSLFHPLINLGYAVRSESIHSIVESLSYLHHSHKAIIYSKSEERNHLHYFGQGKLSFIQVIERLQADKEPLEDLQKNIEIRMRTQQDQWFSSTPQYRIAAMLEHGDMLLQYTHMLHIPSLYNSDFNTVNPILLSYWLFDQAIALYALCENKNEFVILHCVTAAWSFCQFVTLLETADAIETARSLLCVIFAAYTVQGCPILHRLPTTVETVSIDDWQILSREALKQEDDEHTYKIVAACKDRWFRLNDKNSSEAQLCITAAKLALNHEVYWHKYNLAQGLSEDSIGVFGIRDNYQ